MKQRLKDEKRNVEEIIDTNVLYKIVDALKRTNMVEDPIAYYVSVNRNISFESIGDLFS